MMPGLVCDGLHSRATGLRCSSLVSGCLEAFEDALKDARVDQRLVAVEALIRRSDAADYRACPRVCTSRWLTQLSAFRVVGR